ncbi:hypothetical protein ES703_103808 [subsurface metagenome]
MNRTKIEWVKNPDGSQGYTCNSKTGCLNRTPEGLCLGGMFPCYAFRLANGRLRKRYLANLILPAHDEADHEAHHSDPFYPRFWPSRLEQIRKRKKPSGIFLDDMSDWMGEYWPEEWTRAEIQVMRDCPQHRFYTLTKQPQNLAKFSPFPENCWVGVTATGYDAFNKALDYLKYIEATVKFISIEPLLEAIPFYMERLAYCGIGWLIIGAQTKPTVYPKIEWVQEIVSATDHAGIPIFLKDNLYMIKPKRQEMPE